jgi:hypothetical protein
MPLPKDRAAQSCHQNATAGGRDDFWIADLADEGGKVMKTSLNHNQGRSAAGSLVGSKRPCLIRPLDWPGRASLANPQLAAIFRRLVAK